MNDDMGRPLLDFHTLDACPHCQRQMHYTQRFPYHDESEAIRRIPHITVCTSECAACGVIYEDYEDLDGHAYDINGQPLSP